MSEGESDDPSPGRASSGDAGYHFFPERKGTKERTIIGRILEGGATRRNLKCLTNVTWCVRNDPYVKLLVGALKSQGCPLNLSRHVSCEECRSVVNGGFDPAANQVVVCQNNSSSRQVACSVLAHELIHMFDYCRANVDFTDLEHLACTEIRAATLMHCSYLAALVDGDVLPWDYRQKHQDCVRRKATMSVLVVRDIEANEASRIVERVFSRCYRDLEPFGRVPRRGSRDAQRVLRDGAYYGYCS